jgi:hypothetical protein
VAFSRLVDPANAEMLRSINDHIERLNACTMVDLDSHDALCSSDVEPQHARPALRNGRPLVIQ